MPGACGSHPFAYVANLMEAGVLPGPKSPRMLSRDAFDDSPQILLAAQGKDYLPAHFRTA